MVKREGESQTEYRSFLLRFWRSGPSSPWRATLEQVGSSEQHSFADLEDLYAFLRSQTGEAAWANRLPRKGARQ